LSATNLDLSPTVLSALGEEMSRGKRGRALWKGLAERSGAYWADRDPQISSLDLPGGEGGICGQMGSVKSVDQFVELDPLRQQAFMQGALWEGKDGGAKDVAGSGFDVMAVISAMPEGVERDEAVMQLAKWASQGDRDAAKALLDSSSFLGQPAFFLANQASKGRSMNGGILSNPEDPTAWFMELQRLYTGGKGNNDELFVLLKLARAQTSFRLRNLLDGAGVGGVQLAERLAQRSVSKPETFVGWMQDDSEGPALQAWWNKVASRVFTDKLARDDAEAPNKLARTPKLDGRGLGGNRNRQAKESEDFSAFLADWQDRRKSLPPLLTPILQRLLADTVRKAIRTRDDELIVKALTDIRRDQGAFGLDQVLEAHCVDSDFAPFTKHGAAERVLAALVGTRMGERLLARE
jgi:hypothetical protein